MNEKIEIAFVSEKTKKAFEELNKGKFSEKQLYEHLSKTFNKLKKKPESGIKIKRKL